MTLKNIITAAVNENRIRIPVNIQYRTMTNDPELNKDEIYDIPFGYCRYNGLSLIALDSNQYDLEDEIMEYGFHETECGDVVLIVTR